MRNFFGTLWCRLHHRRPMWPIHGKYVCGACWREYRVAWDAPAAREELLSAPAARVDDLALR